MPHGRINPKAALWVIGLFVIEVLIALIMHDPVVRPYGGDVLAALLVYVAFRVVLQRTLSARLAIAAFTVGTCVEVFQALQLPERLGFTHNAILRVVVGTTFQWGDLLAYAMGASIGWFIDEKTSWIR